MRTLILFTVILFPALSQASAERDALIGSYHGVQPNGRACHLIVKNAGGKTDLEFTDSMGTRFFQDIGQELEAQLLKRSPILVFKKTRRTLGDANIHLELLRSNGFPVSMRGSVTGWLRAEIDCRRMRR